MPNASNRTAPKQAKANNDKQTGDALALAAATDLPEGVIAVNTVQYKVGPYTYTNLDDALAEHRRQNTKKGQRK